MQQAVKKYSAWDHGLQAGRSCMEEVKARANARRERKIRDNQNQSHAKLNSREKKNKGEGKSREGREGRELIQQGKNIEGIKKYQLNFTTLMPEVRVNKVWEAGLGKEKNSQNNFHQKNNQESSNHVRYHNESAPKRKNGTSTSRISEHFNLEPLLHQLRSLESLHHSDTKFRFQSQVFVLQKRRNNLFRNFQRRANESQAMPQQKLVWIDSLRPNKKPSTKNAIKTYKILSSHLDRGLQPLKATEFLQYLSSKVNIPLQQSTKSTSNQIGYKESDIRRVRKYHIVMGSLPPVGCSLDLDAKRAPQLDEHSPDHSQAEALDSQVDCFQEKPLHSNYTLPDDQICFTESKREIFKVSRLLLRFKNEQESTLKRIAYLCVKEVERRYIRSLRNQAEYTIRGKKLHRECLVYWRKREKQLIELKKKKDRIEVQLKKRDDEEQQAKKQEKRLEYIMYKSGLYSHFMATKLGVEAPEPTILPTTGIDEEAAQMSVNQMITNKKENLQKFDQKKELDLSEVPQVEIIGAPSSFHGVLKQYQLKGLQWLNNLFEQGINGILADEMGLGKTIQAIALLAHVSQTKGVWGPFLIIAPNSTLFNWEQQFKKFCPALKVLPYWGNIKERKIIRKFFSAKKFTQKESSPFHVVITSYQLTVSDEKAFKRLKWQFMILDEAQAIKNIFSQRWKTLKQFQSRNRLLLTGTPIQNKLAQLWALLNFVMPDLFDSHQLFNQWFSKDIEAHSQDQKQLDEIKVERLRAILKPFMLRRIKEDVEHEIGKKYQHQVLCEMTRRQKLLYESIKERLSVKDLFKMEESKAKVQNLMNLVMQLRKVCNHPELFQRKPPRSPFYFQQFYYSTVHSPLRTLSFSDHNPITIGFSRLAYDQLIHYCQPKKLYNIYSVLNTLNNPSFSFLNLIPLSLSQFQMIWYKDQLYTNILTLHWLTRGQYSSKLSTNCYINNLTTDYSSLLQINKDNLSILHHAYIPTAIASPIRLQVSSIAYNTPPYNDSYRHFLLHGKYQSHWKHLFDFQFHGLLSRDQSLTPIQIVDFGTLIGDSSKLRELDRLLKEKKEKGDKVLIFCQMTKMIDILEDVMNLRKYTFYRLDGSTNIADRRDMVNGFQKANSKVFVFLLSTRAGGLGVTLTAANTVIFYDNDWNPTMDAQATDRAHRIGQSSDVNVYQLVTKSTIEERIVKRAQQKKTVQSTVYQGASSFNFFKKDIIIELMADEFDADAKIEITTKRKNKPILRREDKEEDNAKKGKEEDREKQMEVEEG